MGIKNKKGVFGIVCIAFSDDLTEMNNRLAIVKFGQLIVFQSQACVPQVFQGVYKGKIFRAQGVANCLQILLFQ